MDPITHEDYFLQFLNRKLLDKIEENNSLLRELIALLTPKPEPVPVVVEDKPKAEEKTEVKPNATVQGNGNKRG